MAAVTGLRHALILHEVLALATEYIDAVTAIAARPPSDWRQTSPADATDPSPEVDGPSALTSPARQDFAVKYALTAPPQAIISNRTYVNFIGAIVEPASVIVDDLAVPLHSRQASAQQLGLVWTDPEQYTAENVACAAWQAHAIY